MVWEIQSAGGGGGGSKILAIHWGFWNNLMKIKELSMFTLRSNEDFIRQTSVKDVTKINFSAIY